MLKKIAQHPPMAGLLAIAIVVLVETVFLASSEPMTGMPWSQPVADDAMLVAKRALFDQAGGAVALIGDSSCLTGVIPKVLEQTLNEKVINLGTLSSFSIAGYAVMARELLQAPQPPRAIVLVVLPQTLAFNQQQARSYTILGRYLIAYHRRSNAYKLTLKDWRSWFLRKHQINRFPHQFGGSYETFTHRINQAGGFLKETNTYEGSANPLTHFELSAFAQQALASLAEDARRHGVPIYLWCSPKPFDAVTQTYRLEVHAQLQQLAIRFPDLRLLHDGLPVDDPAMFGSINHLNPEGAKVYSQRLANELQRAWGHTAMR